MNQPTHTAPDFPIDPGQMLRTYAIRFEKRDDVRCETHLMFIEYLVNPGDKFLRSGQIMNVLVPDGFEHKYHCSFDEAVVEELWPVAVQVGMSEEAAKRLIKQARPALMVDGDCYLLDAQLQPFVMGRSKGNNTQSAGRVTRKGRPISHRSPIPCPGCGAAQGTMHDRHCPTAHKRGVPSSVSGRGTAKGNRIDKIILDDISMVDKPITPGAEVKKCDECKGTGHYVCPITAKKSPCSNGCKPSGGVIDREEALKQIAETDDQIDALRPATFLDREARPGDVVPFEWKYVYKEMCKHKFDNIQDNPTTRAQFLDDFTDEIKKGT